MEFIRTNSDNPDFIALVQQLDRYLAEKDGDEHSFYDQYNKLNTIKHVIVAYENNIPVGCGAIKEFNREAMEVKRMYTVPAFRGKGIAKNILMALEIWAEQLGYKKCVLETGKRQQEAIVLYNRSGYNIIPNYGQYIGMDNSICFEKIL